MEQDPLLSAGTDECPNEEPSDAPWLLRHRCSRSFILITVTMAVFTDTFFYAVIIPALPFMLRDRCNIPEEDIQFWASALLAIVGGSTIIASPFSGYFADNMHSRKLPFNIGLGAVAASAVLFGITRNIWLLALSRIFFAISSTIVYTVGLALIIDSVDTDEVGEWIGTALSGTAVGITVSPLAGGLIYDRFKVTGILVVMVVLVSIDIILRSLMIERKEAAKWLGPSILPKKSEAKAKNDSGIARVDEQQGDGIQDLERSVKVSAESQLPILRLLSSARVWADLYSIFTNFGIINAFDAVLPSFVRASFGWTATQAGLIYLTVAIPTMLGPVAAKLAARFGTARVAITGCLLACPALICMRLVTDDSMGHIVLLCFLLTFTGFCLTLITTPTATDLSTATDLIEANSPGVFGERGAYGQAYSLFNCSMAIGCLFGPVVAGAVEQRFGWGSMGLVLGIWSASAAVPVYFLVDDKNRERNMTVSISSHA